MLRDSFYFLREVEKEGAGGHGVALMRSGVKSHRSNLRQRKISPGAPTQWSNPTITGLSTGGGGGAGDKKKLYLCYYYKWI